MIKKTKLNTDLDESLKNKKNKIEEEIPIDNDDSLKIDDPVDVEEDLAIVEEVIKNKDDDTFYTMGDILIADADIEPEESEDVTILKSAHKKGEDEDTDEDDEEIFTDDEDLGDDFLDDANYDKDDWDYDKD